MHVRETVDADETLVELTNGDGITLGGIAGTILLELTVGDTTGLPVSSTGYPYDLELVPPDGKVVRLLEGKITVTAEVTR